MEIKFMSDIKRILKRLEESRRPEVGIFYKINGKIYGIGEAYTDVTPVYNVCDIDDLHIDYFEDLKYLPELGLTDKDQYDWYPRGRVIYYTNEDKFKVRFDQCLNDIDDKYAIANEFKLPFAKIEWIVASDEYFCPDCNSELAKERELS